MNLLLLFVHKINFDERGFFYMYTKKDNNTLYNAQDTQNITR